jgi:hypothetical protein
MGRRRYSPEDKTVVHLNLFISKNVQILFHFRIQYPVTICMTDVQFCSVERKEPLPFLRHERAANGLRYYVAMEFIGLTLRHRSYIYNSHSSCRWMNSCGEIVEWQMLLCQIHYPWKPLTLESLAQPDICTTVALKFLQIPDGLEMFLWCILSNHWLHVVCYSCYVKTNCVADRNTKLLVQFIESLRSSMYIPCGDVSEDLWINNSITGQCHTLIFIISFSADLIYVKFVV